MEITHYSFAMSDLQKKGQHLDIEHDQACSGTNLRSTIQIKLHVEINPRNQLRPLACLLTF